LEFYTNFQQQVVSSIIGTVGFLENVGQIGGIIILNLIFVALAYWVTLWIFAAVNQRWQELGNWMVVVFPWVFSIPLIVVSMLVNWFLKHKSRWL